MQGKRYQQSHPTSWMQKNKIRIFKNKLRLEAIVKFLQRAAEMPTDILKWCKYMISVLMVGREDKVQLIIKKKSEDGGHKSQES